MKKEVLSVKVDSIWKELLSEGANYLRVSQGELIGLALSKYMQEHTNYVRLLNENWKSEGIFVNEIIHEAVGIEYTKLLEKPESLIQEFYEEYDLWANSQFENKDPQDITLNHILNSESYVDWDLFIKKKLKDASLNRIETELTSSTGISGNLLLMLMPDLNKILSIEIDVQISLKSEYYPISLTYYVDTIICSTSLNSNYRGFHHTQLGSFMSTLNDKEKIWIFTVFHLFKNEYRKQNPSIEIMNEFLTKLLDEKTYAIFNSSNILKSVVEKALNVSIS